MANPLLERVRIQYPEIVGPLHFTFVDVSWISQTPYLEPKPRVVQGGLFEPVVPEHTAPLCWEPHYPSQVPDFLRKPRGGEFAPPRDVTTAPLCWLGTYPASAPDARRNPLGGQYEPPVDTTASPLCWVPAYPDLFRVPFPVSIVQGEYALLQDVVPLLSWAPVIPHWLARRLTVIPPGVQGTVVGAGLLSDITDPIIYLSVAGASVVLRDLSSVRVNLRGLESSVEGFGDTDVILIGNTSGDVED